MYDHARGTGDRHYLGFEALFESDLLCLILLPDLLGLPSFLLSLVLFVT